MAGTENIAKNINLLFSAYGRKPDSVDLEAYSLALEECSDYQLDIAIRLALRVVRDWVPPAGEIRQLCRNQDRSPEARLARLERERLKALPEGRPDPAAIAGAMAEQCRKIIAREEGPKAEFAAGLLKRLENNKPECAPAEVVAAMFGR